jgi:chemotaxis protein CheC
LAFELNEIQKDMFGEVGNVGVGNAATALSVMINKKVDLSLPETEVITKENLMRNLSNEVLLVNSKLEGDLTGNLIVIYDKQTAFPLIDLLLGNEKGTLKEIDEMAKSVFKEMVNVIAGPYLDSLADMSGYRVLPKPPTFTFGNLVAIRDIVTAELPAEVNEIISVKTEITVEEEKIFGDIFLVLDKPSLEKLMESFSMKSD